MSKFKLSFSEKELIQAVLDENAKRKRSAYFTEIYQKVTPYVYKRIKNQRGSQEDAEDVVQQAMLKLITNIKTGKFIPKGSFNSYFWGICFNIWRNTLKKRVKMPTNGLKEYDKADEPEVEQQAELLFREEVYDLVKEKLKKLSNKCQKLLQETIYEEKKMTTLPLTIFDADKPTTYKYLRKMNAKCKKCLIELVRNDIRFKNR